jgi:predicted histidine transporter YuiF (NhaC family)
MLVTNPVVVSVTLIFVICALRANLVITLTIGASICRLANGASFENATVVFPKVLEGIKIAFSYAILGTFASALAHSAFLNFLMSKITRLLKYTFRPGNRPAYAK